MIDQAASQGAVMVSVEGVGRRSATALVRAAQDRLLPVVSRSSLIARVERTTKSGSRRDAGDEPWKADVLIRAQIHAEGSFDGYHSPDGSPPPESWDDGEIVIEGDDGPIYLYGIAGAFRDGRIEAERR